VEAAEKYGSSWLRIAGYEVVASAYAQRAEWDDAISAARHAESLTRERKIGFDREVNRLSILSRAHLGRGDVEEARDLAERAAARARANGSMWQEIRGRLALARALLASGDKATIEAIQEHLDTTTALIESTEAEGYRPQVLVERAELARLRGDEVEAEHHLHEAHRLYTEMGATGHSERLARELGLGEG
jgi:ATP/maltotriose-dependent transcriptional regulator MalT